MQKVFDYAIIGCGSFGEIHATTLLKMDTARIVALCDKHIESAEGLKKKYDIDAPCYDDYEKMLKEIKADIVVVVTADHAHRGATVAALNAGFNVMCEKPMALVMDDCKAMLEAYDKSGKELMVGQICRFTPSFAKAKEIVDSGLIGELYFVESEYAHDYKDIPGVDKWRMHPDRDPVIGGACHAIDLLRWIAGDPTEVSAYSVHKLLLDWPIPDTTVSIMKFPNGVIGKVLASIGCKRDYTMRTVLYGTKGTIIVDNTNSYFSLFLEKDGEKGLADGYFGGPSVDRIFEHKIPIEVNNHNAGQEHLDMQAALRGEKKILTTGREGAKTVAVCRAVVESAKKGGPVKVDYNF